MKKHLLLSITFIAFVLSSVGHANPGLLWDLVRKATLGPVESEEWSQVSSWLTNYIEENIDWNPAGEESARVLMQRHNPKLYDSLFGAPAETRLAKAAPARLFGLDAYGSDLETLGTGFSGAVVKRVHKLSRAPVAVKTLRKAQYEKCQLPFPPTEAKLMKRLWHPNIVRFYEAIMTAEAQYLIMELVTGSDLFEFAQNNNLIPEDACKPIIAQVLAALDCMHRAQICHRDLKHENILMNEKGTVKVIDLGLACFFDRISKIDKFCGSVEFAAPEIHRQTPYIGPELDIWAVGVILYDLAMGTLPFATPDDTMALTYESPSHEEFSAPFCGLIQAVFQDADKRASLEQLIKHKWFKGN